MEGAMAWRVGIDEAGYGPNLGPLVMSAVVCGVPEEHAQASLWKVLKTAVRKSGGRGAAKLPVDDSKKIYSTARGLADLERSVLAILTGSLADCFKCPSPPYSGERGI
jgi:ribonuclease HII